MEKQRTKYLGYYVLGGVVVLSVATHLIIQRTKNKFTDKLLLKIKNLTDEDTKQSDILAKNENIRKIIEKNIKVEELGKKIYEIIDSNFYVTDDEHNQIISLLKSYGVLDKLSFQTLDDYLINKYGTNLSSFYSNTKFGKVNESNIKNFRRYVDGLKELNKDEISGFDKQYNNKIQDTSQKIIKIINDKNKSLSDRAKSVFNVLKSNNITTKSEMSDIEQKIMEVNPRLWSFLKNEADSFKKEYDKYIETLS